MGLNEAALESLELTTIVTIPRDRGEVTIFKAHDGEHPYIVRYNYPGEATVTLVWGCESFQKAQLVAGLFLNMKESVGSERLQGVFDFGYDESVPIPIAVSGQDNIAAYLKIVEDLWEETNTRNVIASMMDVNKQSVSNYLNRIRWGGCINCGSEQIEKKILRVDTDEVHIAECFDCDHYHVIPEDLKKEEHEKRLSEMCVDTLEPAMGTHGNDEFRLYCCISCGFYTAKPERHQTEQTT